MTRTQRRKQTLTDLFPTTDSFLIVFVLEKGRLWTQIKRQSPLPVCQELHKPFVHTQPHNFAPIATAFFNPSLIPKSARTKHVSSLSPNNPAEKQHLT